MSQLIFIVEDDADISRLVCHHLQAAGFRVRAFLTATEVIHEGEKAHPSLFLLDIMLPGRDGLDLCRRIRQSSMLSKAAVVFLTARTGEEDRILGLELGGDDYITKPFSPRELVARVKAVLRRFEPALAPRVTTVGAIEIDSGAMTLSVHGKLVSTTATEFRLLDYLAQHPGRVFSRDQLLEAVWRDAQFVTVRSVDVYVRRLREKVEPDPENPTYLKTVRGIGYRFETTRGSEAPALHRQETANERS
ncbi:MAG TPA: response regulator transcription factor [Terriglobales bacterium]|nr:response regulator transcription factor [Terriglobales bacterium]